MREITIGNTKLGGDNPCFIVGEIGINFDGKYEQAIELIDIVADGGCNAAKFQMFTAERMYPRNAGQYTTAAGKTRDIIDVVKEGELPPEWVPKLKQYAHSRGIEFFSTVCDEQSGDILERNGVDAYKFASYELTHLPLFEYVAKKGKPIIFSCGGGMLKEIAEAIEVIKGQGLNDIILMHCIGQYPAERDKVNLNVLKTLQLAFPDVVIGYSDHTVDHKEAPRAAVALGAKIIEKHVTVDKNLPGPDHYFAVDPDSLKAMVQTIRETEEVLIRGDKIEVAQDLLGSSERITYPHEQYWRDFAYRTIFAARDIKQGEVFSSENIAVLRPGNNRRGLEPKYYSLLVGGYRAIRDIPLNKSIVWDDIMQRY